MKSLLLVFLGGGAGSALRYLMGKWLNGNYPDIPFGTFMANVLGCLIIGLLLGYATKTNSLSETSSLLLATGFCGGFTTFSTFAYENQVFLKNGDLGLFAVYTFGSLALGLAAVFIGLWMTSKLF